MDEQQRIARIEERLDEIFELTEENNVKIKSLERTARWSFWGRLLIWVIVLILPFIVLGPLLKSIVPGLAPNNGHSLFGLPSEQQLQQLLDTYKQASTTTAR